jgi:hypothetical protein
MTTQWNRYPKFIRFLILAFGFIFLVLAIGLAGHGDVETYKEQGQWRPAEYYPDIH